MAQHIMIGTLVVMVSLLAVSHAALTKYTVCTGDCSGNFNCVFPGGCTKGFCDCQPPFYYKATSLTEDSCNSGASIIAEGDTCDTAKPENGICDLGSGCAPCPEDYTTVPLPTKCLSGAFRQTGFTFALLLPVLYYFM